MTIKFPLSSIAVLVAGLTVTGCASKQSWSPVLEDARQALQQVSSDPLVSELAAAELSKAQQQLQVAENASDYFKGVEEISHEAALAKLAALEAQQTARAIAAKQNLRFAQATGQLPGPLPTMGSPTPVMAAATPMASSYPSANNNARSSNAHYGSLQGGHTTLETPLSDTQQIAQQLAALSQQIMQLQQRIDGGAMQNASNPVHSQSYIQAATQPVMQPLAQPAPQTIAKPIAQYVESSPAAVSIQPNRSNQVAFKEKVIATTHHEEYANTVAAEPVLEAALAAPAAVQPLADEGLQEELRAMNAQPSSRGMSLTLGERYFEADSARIWNGRAARHLDNIAAVMSENPTLTLDIEAHTDNSGTAEFRHNLSSDRAIAIKSALVLRGVNAGQINSAGFGDSAPIADNSTELGKLQNRRVEIIFPSVAQ